MKAFWLRFCVCLQLIFVLAIYQGDDAHGDFHIEIDFISTANAGAGGTGAKGDLGNMSPVEKKRPLFNFNKISEEFKQFVAALNNRIMVLFQCCEICLVILFIFLLISIQKKRLKHTIAQCTKELAACNQKLIEEISEQKGLHKKLHEQEAKLRCSQKMEALGRLAGGIAHEFNNILGIILGYAELTIEETAPHCRTKFNLEEIKRAGLRGSQVVHRLLVCLNKIPADKSIFKLGPCIIQSIESVKSTLSGKIEIKTDLKCREETILGNPSDLNQILTNLVTNAVQAIGDASGTISITLESIRLNRLSAMQYEGIAAGDFARLIVVDTGCGMEPNVLERVFEPYFTTKKINEGIGMGLSVVYGVIKEMGGTIRVSSRPKEGTRCELIFPLLDDRTNAGKE